MRTMGETVNCPNCGGEAIPRPKWMGGGVFCNKCGVVKKLIRDPREATAKIRSLATESMDVNIGLKEFLTIDRLRSR